MSLSVITTRALLGLRAPRVTVETHLSNGIPRFALVGLPETEVKEARDRVRSALLTSGFDFPTNRVITVNLAPADLPKESGRFDLPLALGILAASGQLDAQALREHEFAGELSLSGELRPVRGALAAALACPDGTRFVLPRASAAEAAIAEHVQALAADHLRDVVAHFKSAEFRLTRATAQRQPATTPLPDLAEVRGQVLAKRALEVAATGRHSLLMVGPPGTGKSMLAQRLPSILPPMTAQEALESAALMSLTPEGFDAARWGLRPVRTPHHSASAPALVGGGSVPRPGEISLAHHGVLFLDELTEFDRGVLDHLREPMEAGRIVISRASRSTEFPARFQLIAAMNPCPCGYLGHPSARCRCSPETVARYLGRISGPLLDRMDLQITVPTPTHEELLELPPGEPSHAVAARVAKAFARQLERQGKANAMLDGKELDAHCPLRDEARSFIKQAMQRLMWSARGLHRVLKVARSIADLDDSDVITTPHLAEAIQYRRVAAPRG